MSTKTPYELRLDIINSIIHSEHYAKLPADKRMEMVLLDADLINQFVSGTYKRPSDPQAAAKILQQSKPEDIQAAVAAKNRIIPKFYNLADVGRQTANTFKENILEYRNILADRVNDTSAETYKAGMTDENFTKLSVTEFHALKIKRIEELSELIDKLDYIEKNWSSSLYNIKASINFTDFEKWLIDFSTNFSKQIWHEAILDFIETDSSGASGYVHYKMPRRSGTTTGIWLLAAYLTSKGEKVHVVNSNHVAEQSMLSFFKLVPNVLEKLTEHHDRYNVVFIDNAPNFTGNWKGKASKIIEFSNISDTSVQKKVSASNDIFVGAVKNLLSQVRDNDICTSAQDQKAAIWKMIEDMER